MHFRHSAVLAEALQKADIPFDFMVCVCELNLLFHNNYQIQVYPNQGHRVRGDAAAHLDHFLETFIAKCYE